MPWDDPSTAFGAALPAVPREIQVRQLKAAAKLAEEKVDPTPVSRALHPCASLAQRSHTTVP